MARSPFLRSLKFLDIEEKILNVSAIVACVAVFLPWFGGEWFGEPKVWTGFGFYTSFVGLLIFLGQAFIIALTVLPMMGYQLFRASVRDLLRLIIALQTVLLMIVVYSVFTNVTFDFAQVGIGFGVHLTLIAGIVESLYAFLRIQQQRKRSVKQFFHHPEDHESPEQSPQETLVPPEAPEPPSSEDENLFTTR